MKSRRTLYLGLDPSRYLCEGELIHLPLIETRPLPLSGELQQAFSKLPAYTHVLFTSRTAVPIYKNYALESGVSFHKLQEKIYLSVGKATTECLEQADFRVKYTAEEQTGEGVVKLFEGLDLNESHLFFPHSILARTLIPRYLEERGEQFTAISLYETHPRKGILPDLATFDTIVFTSPSTVHAFFAQTKVQPPKEKCIPIGPITEKTLNVYLRKL